ncbi:MAG TPA: tetratricopeptide repeat protein [Polyangiaceae bacterium]|nr:tetratricopeptide repeat protein [Polyangiaceae bacterium]
MTAIELEYRAMLDVSAGAQPGSAWSQERHQGLPVAFRTFEGVDGRPLRVALARGSGMGMVETMGVLAPLVDKLAPRCIAMSGVCAGRPGKTALGDVIAAERLFAHDTGKQLPGGVQRDLETYNLRRDWRVELERFDPAARFGAEAWWRERPTPYEWQENWVLANLSRHDPPRRPAEPAPPAAHDARPLALPPRPPLVLGRDELIEPLCATLLRDPAPAVVLLGPGGIGKSTLTLAALHRPEVVARFGTRRWFVRLDAASTADAAVGLLSAALGLPPLAQPLPAVQAFLAQAPGVLALDNLETPWEAAGEREATEALLHTLTAIPGLALVASVRGQQRPHGLGAQHLTVPPLRASAASALFCEISQARPDDPALGPLLAQLEGVPLAITLLAHVAEGASVAGLAAEWQQKRTELLRREGAEPGRETSWAASMALSVGSPRMTDEARRLLALLGRLPDGVAFADLATLLPETWHEAQRRLVQVGLAYHEGERVRVLAPVREYARATMTPAPDNVVAARSLYGHLAKTLGPKAGREGGAEAIARLVPETANLEAMVGEGLTSDEPTFWVDAAVALTNFVRISGHSSPLALQTALVIARDRGDLARQARCLESLGGIALARSRHDEARRLYAEARQLHRQVGDVLGEANCIQGLGAIALRRSRHDEARSRYEEASQIYRQVGSVQGEANCVRGLGDVALTRSDLATATAQYQTALSLYAQIPEPYSMELTHRRLARLATDAAERQRHVAAARELLAKIDRPDLVAELDAEFGLAPPHG